MQEKKQGRCNLACPGTIKLLTTAGTAGAVLTVILALACLILDRVYPLPLSGRPVATVVTDRHHQPLRIFADSKGIWRFPARPDQVSPLYLEALLTYEDRWFYRHPGINPLAMARAMVQNLAHGRVISGGSTITMQVARILNTGAGAYISPVSSPAGQSKGPFQTKILQVLRALQLEWHLTKDEILGIYLTCAPFGANIEGVRAAALTWLGKDADSLTHAEAALLAVLPQAPSRYRPDRHPQRAAKARNKVLDRMAAFSVWPRRQVTAAKQEPVMPFRFPNPVIAPLAARRLRQAHPSARIVDTLIDQGFQIHMENLLQNYLSVLPPRQSGAVLVVNNTTLAVKAYAGSGDFFDQRRCGHVDMVRAIRSPGSTLKPFIYGLAMDAGLVHSHSLLMDVPRFGQDYNPGNFTRGFSGPVTLARALQDSLNLPAVQVLEAYGPARCHDRLKNAGARLEFAGRPNLSMALGGVGTSLESLVTLYTALGRGGIAARPRLAPDAPLVERYLMSPGAAWIIRQILTRPMPGQQHLARLSGTLAAAWKTGTSYGFRDAWALGLKGNYTIGVWVGRPDGTPSPGQYGAITALPLLAQVMESLAVKGQGPVQPATVQKETICWPSGLAQSAVQGKALGACARKFSAWILDNQIPPTLAGHHDGDSPAAGNGLVQRFWINDQGDRATPLCGGTKKISAVLWPWQVQPFIPDQWRQSSVLPNDSPACPDLAPLPLSTLKIVSIDDNSVVTCQPGSTSATLPLAALGGQGNRIWFLNRSPIGSPDAMTMPPPGRYQLSVADESGHCDQVRFTVIQMDTPPPQASKTNPS